MQFFQIHGALTNDLIQEQHIDWLYAAIESQSEKQKKRINLVKKRHFEVRMLPQIPK